MCLCHNMSICRHRCQRGDAGEYQCVAESEAGVAERTVSLKVQSKWCVDHEHSHTNIHILLSKYEIGVFLKLHTRAHKKIKPSVALNSGQEKQWIVYFIL